MNIRRNVAEGAILFLVTSFDGGGIRTAPVRDDRLPRPHRTAFASVVADGDNEVKLDAAELFPRFTSSFRGVDVVNILQYLNGNRINFARRKRTGAKYLEPRLIHLS